MWHLQGDKLARAKQRILSSLSIEKDSVNNVEYFKWIILHGIKYLVDKCYLAVKFDDEEVPMFGKLCGILELSISFVVFDIIFWRQFGLMTLLEHMKYTPEHLRLCQ